jgi:peptidoglycan hydrolase-like protein with peptidoglycan-binding domain
MRLTTVAILTLLTFFMSGLSRGAIAADQKKSLTEQLEESGLYTPGAAIKPIFGDVNSQGKLFTAPYHQALQQPQKKEKTLSKGDRGVEVAAVQQHLQAYGLKVGVIDGDFGSLTVAAVKDFQQSEGLPVNGVVNKATWIALKGVNKNIPQNPVVMENPMVTKNPAVTKNPVVMENPVATKNPAATNTVKILVRGATGSKVKTLQARLDMKGYDPGAIDGIFGSRTMAAVKDFQEAYGLRVDGVVDEATWKALSWN